MSDSPAPISNTQAYSKLLDDLRAWQSMRQQQQNVLDNPMASTMSDWMARTLGQKSAEDMRRSELLNDRVMGNVLPMLSGAFMNALGWSPSSMVLAGQNVIGQGGMNVTDLNGRPMPLTGYSPVAGQLSAQLWSQVQDHFFNPGGSLNYDRTYGASRDDIAGVMHDLQRRGAFTGMTAGQLEVLSADRINQLRTTATAAGDKGMLSELENLKPGDSFATLNPQVTSRLQSWSQETIKSIQELRGVLGNLPTQQILGELERLTGTNLASPEALRNAMSSIRSTMASGMTMNMSPHQALEFQAATINTLDSVLAAKTGGPAGSFYSAAGAMSAMINDRAAAAYNEQRAAGGHRNPGEIAARMAADIGTLFTENPEVLESLTAANMMQKGSAPYQAIMDSVQAFQNAGTVSQREEARLNMARVMREQAGIRSGWLSNTIGIGGMMSSLAETNPELLQTGVDVMGKANQQMMVGDYNRIMNGIDVGSPLRRAFGSQGGDFAHEIFSTIPRKDLNEIQDLIRTQGIDAASERLSAYSLPTFGNAANAFASGNDALQRASGGQLSMADFTSYYGFMTDNMSGLGPMVTERGRSSQASETSLRANTGIPLHGMTTLSPIEQLEQSMFGGRVSLEDQMLIRYDEATGGKNLRRLKLNKEGDAFDLDEASAGELAKHMRNVKTGKLSGVDLYKLLGAKDDKELAAKLRDPANAAKAKQLLSGNPDEVIGLASDKDSTSLIYATDPAKLREDVNKDIEKAEKAGSNTTVKAAADAAGKAASRPVQFIVNTGSNTLKWTGHMVG
jgi:hypothetical protein